MPRWECSSMQGKDIEHILFTNLNLIVHYKRKLIIRNLMTVFSAYIISCLRRKSQLLFFFFLNGVLLDLLNYVFNFKGR